MNSLATGFSLILFASIAAGVFAMPLRFRRRYAVENMWVVAFLLGYLLLPHLAVQFLLPDWTRAMRTVGNGPILLAIGFGLGWGLASILFVQAIARVGLSLGYAVIMGLNTVVGSIIPLLRRWESVPTAGRGLVLAGILAALVGVCICGRAGVLRDRGTGRRAERSPDGRSLVLGFVWCFFSGVLSACANLGFEYAEPLADAVCRTGVHPVLASMVRWLPVYWGGSAMVVGISAWQMWRNRTWDRYCGAGAQRDLVLALLMGLLLSLGQIPYGMGAHYLGPLGTSVGFAMNATLTLIVANLVGFFTGEWRGTGSPAGGTLATGITVLALAMVLLGWGNAVAMGPAI